MPGIGLYLCECGPNIADSIDLDLVAAEVEKDGKVARVERFKLLCSEDGKKFLAESIKEHGYGHVVVAACSPKQHQTTFEEVAAGVGLNPHMIQMVNIREQCAWMTPDKEEATGKALRLVRAAVSRVRYHRALEQKEIECNPDVVVIGGGTAGVEAARRIAHEGRKVHLLGVAGLGSEPGADDAPAERVEELKQDPLAEVHEGCTVQDLLGFFGSFIARVKTREEEEIEIRAGSVVLATGAKPFDPAGFPGYGYGMLAGVTTVGEHARAEDGAPALGTDRPVKSVAVIHCVGREKLGYCSGTCCMEAMGFARRLKQSSPETEVTEFFRDLCLPGIGDDGFHRETEELGVHFVRFRDVEVAQDGDGLAVRYQAEDGSSDSLAVDAVVLAVGVKAGPSNADFAGMLNLGLDEHGFFQSEHPVLNPVGTVTEGVFTIGSCRGPASTSDVLIQAGAAAGKVLSALVPGRRMKLETRTSEVADKLCTGCGLCVAACAYGAVTRDDARRVAVVNEVLCRGCGNCAAACPSGAAQHRQFTARQLDQEVTQVLG